MGEKKALSRENMFIIPDGGSDDRLNVGEYKSVLLVLQSAYIHDHVYFVHSHLGPVRQCSYNVRASSDDVYLNELFSLKGLGLRRRCTKREAHNTGHLEHPLGAGTQCALRNSPLHLDRRSAGFLRPPRTQGLECELSPAPVDTYGGKAVLARFPAQFLDVRLLGLLLQQRVVDDCTNNISVYQHTGPRTVAVLVLRYEKRGAAEASPSRVSRGRPRRGASGGTSPARRPLPATVPAPHTRLPPGVRSAQVLQQSP